MNTEKSTLGSVLNLAPTFFDIAGAKYPTTVKNIKINALPGKSLSKLLFNGEALNRTEPLFWELWGNRAMRIGKWKMVSSYPGYKWHINQFSTQCFEWAKKNEVVLDFDRIKPKSPIEVKLN
jgi:arylsulfatase A-like enzyme